MSECRGDARDLRGQPDLESHYAPEEMRRSSRRWGEGSPGRGRDLGHEHLS